VQNFFKKFSQNPLTNRLVCGIIDTERERAKAQTNKKKIKKFFKNLLTNGSRCGIISM
jgi:hypothetical protein